MIHEPVTTYTITSAKDLVKAKHAEHAEAIRTAMRAELAKPADQQDAQMLTQGLRNLIKIEVIPALEEGPQTAETIELMKALHAGYWSDAVRDQLLGTL